MLFLRLNIFDTDFVVCALLPYGLKIFENEIRTLTAVRDEAADDMVIAKITKT